MGRVRLDPFALAASALATGMLGVYLSVIRQQGDSPAPWVVAAFVIGAVAAGYGAIIPVPHRRGALAGAAVVLMGLGFLAILSIGLPVLAAGLLCVVAIARHRPTPAPETD
jgi:hypothetical protein